MRSIRLLPWAAGLLAALAFGCFTSQLCFLVDDAFISFRYAQNLVEGHGLVFNPGEWVEGYSNFLWVLLMAGALALRLPAEGVAVALGVASGAAILGLVAWAGARERPRGFADPTVWIAPLALASNRSFCAWSTGGLETQFFALLVFAGLLRLAVERERGEARPWGSALLLALACLTRPDGPLFAALGGAFLGADALRRRRLGPALRWLAVLAPPVLAHLLWRRAYYGFWVPNTFYAKVSGLWLDQGAAYLGFFLRDHWLFWLLPLLLLALLPPLRFRSALFATALGAWSAYLLAVGGDRFEYRLLTPVLPFLYLLLQRGVQWLADRARRPGWRGDLGLGLASFAGLLVVVGAYAPLTRGFEPARGVVPVEWSGVFAARRVEEGRFLRQLVEEGFLRGDELLAVGAAGAVPYYSGLPTLDVLGLNDVAIAHQPIDRRGTVAHEKFAAPELLRERGVALCDALDQLVVPEGDFLPQLPATRLPYFDGPVHLLRAGGRYLTIGTLLPPAEFRRVFARFEIVY